MTFKLLAAAAVLSLASVASANAAPLGMAQPTLAPAAPIELVGHQGTNCFYGKGSWHYHTPSGAWMACKPKPSGAYYSWKCEGSRCGWWHSVKKAWY